MTKTDLELIDNVILNNDSISFTELANRHTPLCNSIYSKYSYQLSASGIPIEDIKEEKEKVILSSILSYKKDKNVKFSSWLGNNIRYQCLHAINKNGRYITMEENDLVKLIDSRVEPNININSDKQEDTNNYNRIIEILNSLSDERISHIFFERYLSCKNKKPWKDIAAKLGVSIQTVINLHNKGLKIIKSKMKSVLEENNN